jgi:hypothetical protein
MYAAPDGMKMLEWRLRIFRCVFLNSAVTSVRAWAAPIRLTFFVWIAKSTWIVLSDLL